MSLVTIVVGLIFAGIGLYYLYRPRLQYFYQMGVFQREDGEVGPTERTLARITATAILLGGLFFIWLGL